MRGDGAGQPPATEVKSNGLCARHNSKSLIIA